MLEKMKTRRTIRQYAERDIPEAILEELLQIAARASNTGNMQLYSVIITRDKARKEKLSPAHFHQPMITKAPVVLTFCADANRFVRWASLRKADAGFDNIQTFMAAVIDSMLFAQTFCVAAEEIGLGVCYLGTTTYNASAIIETLSLPRLVVPVTVVTAGYPAEPLPEQPERLPLAAVVHQEEYTDYNAAAIDALYSDKESLEVNLKYIKENRKETLAQVFTDIRYTRKNNEFFSEEYLNVLKEQGFLK
jgi:nitroreductase